MAERYQGRVVLVTGASGFLGRALCRRLVSEGAEVHGISRRDPRLDRLCWVLADVTSGGRLADVVAEVRPNAVFHLAGHVTGARDLSAVGPTFAVNAASTVALLTAAASLPQSPRIVLSGSVEENAENPGAAPASPYTASKRAAWSYARLFNELYGQNVVNARICMAYGTGQDDAKKLVPYVIGCFARGEAPKLTSGRRRADWVYVDDVTESLLRIGALGPDSPSTYKIGTGTLTDVRGVAETIQRLMRSDIKPDFGRLEERAFEQEHAADPEESLRALGWTPSIPLEEGLRRTIDYYTSEA